jgi:sugar O-acyltransferase (sialic acid O-acetyltransferase NeuD family)
MTKLLYVPLVNANEDEVEIADVSVGEGERVRAGQVVCLVETTKATVDVEAPVAGYVRKLTIRKGQRCRVGALICAFTATPDEAVVMPVEAPAPASEDSTRATRKAQELAARHRIDLASLGITGIIKEKDVERFIAQLSGSAKTPLAFGVWSPTPEQLPTKDRWIALYGAGGHARVLVDLIRQGACFEPVAAVDDAPEASDVLGVPVIGGSDKLALLREKGVGLAALGIGSVTAHRRRAGLYERLVSVGFKVPNLVHPRAIVEPSVTMGVGNQLFAGAVVGSAVQLGDDTIINSGAVISHDCRIGSHTHISPGAILAGGVSVGENTLVGMGVTIYLGVRVGSNVTIANGAAIFSDVPDGATVRVTSARSG